MTNLLEQAINSNDGDHAARLIQEALGIESDEVVNYCFPKAWPNDPSSALGSSANGCRPKPVFLPDAGFPLMLFGCRSSVRVYPLLR